METIESKPETRTLEVLFVEDNPADVELCLRELRRGGLDARADVVQTSHELCVRVSEKSYDVVLVDYTLPTCTGAEVMELLQQMGKGTPFILITGTLEDEVAAECLKLGAADYVQKDRLARLPLMIERALEVKKLREARGQWERGLRRAEKRYQLLAELSSEALFILVDDQLAYVNPVGAKLVGAGSGEELVGRPWREIVPGSRHESMERNLLCLAAEQEALSFEGQLIRLDGKVVDVRMAGVPVSYGDRPAVQLTAHDVTERKRVEEAIKSLAAFAQLNPNPVLEFSREGKLTYFNGAAGEMAAALGKEHVLEALPAGMSSIVSRCLAGRKKLNVDTAIGGRTFAWSFFPIEVNGVVHCYVNEITERLNLEGQLRHSQKLESVGRLAAGVAHDFNNILTVIQGHMGLLRADPNVGAEMGESVQQVSRAAERASKLTNQLLAFSRKSIMQRKRLDLNEVLTNITTMLYRTLGEDIAFQFSYAPDLPAVWADVAMIEQVIMNLAVNARDAMPEGGQLVISTAGVDVDEAYVERDPEARPGRFICLSILDTGCGMDHVTMGRLFEPFFTTKEFGKGTGLGLATVYGIVKQHQGWVEVQSQVDQGTTFKLFLPPSEAVEVESSEAAPESVVESGSEIVLVVEDEAPVRTTARNVLERYGYQVLEAANGVEALAVWHRHQQDIALLLTDVVMPVGLSGQELAEKFLALKPGLKVIYTSGYSVDVAGKGLEGTDDLRFLQKPFDARMLAQTVRECLDE